MSFPGQHQSFRIRLLGSREIAPSTRHFTFETPEAESFQFVPGQFLSLTAEINGKPITRAYSMASVPERNRIEFCLNLVPDGLFSSYLFALAPGMAVEAKGPYGSFIFRQPGHSICVATGTGIAPFRPMLRQRLPEDPSHEYILIFGARYQEGLAYLPDFEQMTRDYPNFRLLTTVTRPGENWTGRTGRVQQHLFDLIGDRRDFSVYVCGLKEMVDEVRSRLREQGFDRKQIVYEKYD